MTTRIAVVPGTPMLIPYVASGAAIELSDIRRAAVDRVAWAAGGGRRINVLAQDPAANSVVEHRLPPRVSLSTLGAASFVGNSAIDSDRKEDSPHQVGDSHPDAPAVSVLVAAWLAAASNVDMGRVWSAPVDPRLVALPTDLDDADGLLVIADGSSTRTPKAPGSFVEGAHDFDDRLLASIRELDVDFFTDEQRATDVDRFGVQGLGALEAAARLTRQCGDNWVGEVDLAADPYGVFYVVAGWYTTPAQVP